LHENNPDVKLLILGEGELFQPLKNYATKLGLKVFTGNESERPDNSFAVFLLGYQANPYKFYKLAKIFVLSSLFEGLPMVIIEALACGLPVVSSDCKFGPRELLFPSSDLKVELVFPAPADFGLLLPVPQGKLGEINKLATDDIWVKTLASFLADKTARQHYSSLAAKRAQDFSLEKIKVEWEELFAQIEK
jgi:glycosyltransferase involved in cell wall biosynthesis